MRVARRYALPGLVVFTCVIAIALYAYPGTAAPRDDEQENEQVVYRGATACGVERWAVKTGIDRDAGKVNLCTVVPTNIIKMRSLTQPALLPTSSRIRPVETTVWAESATLNRFKMETDSDYYLVLSDTGGWTKIADVSDATGSHSTREPSAQSD